MTLSKGCDWWRRNTSLSFRSSAVRFLSLGVYCAHHTPRRLRTRRKYYDFLYVLRAKVDLRSCPKNAALASRSEPSFQLCQTCDRGGASHSKARIGIARNYCAVPGRPGAIASYQTESPFHRVDRYAKRQAKQFKQRP